MIKTKNDLAISEILSKEGSPMLFYKRKTETPSLRSVSVLGVLGNAWHFAGRRGRRPLRCVNDFAKQGYVPRDCIKAFSCGRRGPLAVDEELKISTILRNKDGLSILFSLVGKFWGCRGDFFKSPPAMKPFLFHFYFFAQGEGIEDLFADSLIR